MNIGRREFVVAAAAGVCGCMVGCQNQGGEGGGGADAQQVADTGHATVDTSTGPVDIGPASNYPRDGVYDRFARSDKIMVVREGGKFSALTAICSHRACMLKNVNDELRCPCHGSRFDRQGTATKGPATRDLRRFAVTEGPGGHLIVDKSKVITANA